MSRLENIQHSTFNIEHLLGSDRVMSWELSVECWVFNVFHFKTGGLP